MKTRYIVYRYLSIIGRLSNGRKATFSQINNYIQNQGIEGEEGISIRTFQRMINDMEFIFQVKIKCDAEGFYFIAEDYSQDQITRLSQSFYMLNYQKHFENYDHLISYDDMCTLGLEHIYEIQKAMKSQYSLDIQYKKFSEGTSGLEYRRVAPYGLKENNGRWYLVGKDEDKKAIRVFGLDRIVEMEASDRRFTLPESFNINDYFQHAIGVFTNEDGVAELVRLKFSNKLAGYIENFPIHDSQVIEEKTDDYIIVKLRIYVNTDTVNQLMMYSDDVEVIKPQSLRKELVKRAQACIRNNS